MHLLAYEVTQHRDKIIPKYKRNERECVTLPVKFRAPMERRLFMKTFMKVIYLQMTHDATKSFCTIYSALLLPICTVLAELQ